MNEIYSGYNITLNKLINRAYKGKMLKIEGESKQETRSGKNRFNINGTILYGSSSQISNNGFILAEDSSNQFGVKFNAIPAGIYTISCNITKNTTNAETIIDIGTDSKNEIYIYIPAGKTGKFTERLTLNSTTTNTLSAYISTTDTGGTSIVLEDIQIEEGTVATSWEEYGASPSINYPSEVKSVGDNINLFNTTFKQNGSYRLLTVDYLEVKENTNYVLKMVSTLNHPLQYAVNYYDKSKTLLSSSTYITNGNGFITPANTKYITIQVRDYYNNETSTNVININEVDKIKLEQGTTATPYSPYGQGSIEIYNGNKNFFDKNNIIQGYFMSTSLYSNSEWCYSIANGLKAGETYTTSGGRCMLSYFNGNTNISVDDITNKTITIPENTTKVYISTLKTNVNTLQVEKGKIATEYIQGKSQTKALYTQQPFRAIGDVKDRFVKQNGVWYEEHNIARKIFDGTEDFMFGKDNNYNRFQITISDIYQYTDNGRHINKIVCSHFKLSTISDYEIIFQYRNTVLMYADFATVDEFKAKLAELYNAGTPLYVDYVLATPELIECTPEQSIILDQLENIQLYDGENHIYSVGEVRPLLELQKYYMMEDYDMYISTEGFFTIPGTDIKFKVNFMESSLPSMPEATESSVRAAGRDGDYVLNTTYEPIPFEIVCYTEDNLTITEKKEIEAKVNRFLNSIKNKTKRLAFERDDKFYNVKYNSLLTTTNYPAHLKFGIPLKSSESYAKDTFEKVIAGNNSEISDTVNPVGALITINGPATLPIISLNDYSIEYSTAILEGARLEIDTSKSTATHINSDGVRTNVMRYYNHQFPKIEAGENTLKVLSGVDDEYNVTVKWNDLKL